MERASTGAGNTEDWLRLDARRLSLDAAARWVTRPDCGAVVTFSGTVRDHAEGRPGVSRLEYESWEAAARVRMQEIAAGLRSRLPDLGRIVLWHRLGSLAVGETAVVVAVSAPHRDEAFAAARWAIDTLKEAVPIWKKETWADGEAWGTGARAVLSAVPSAAGGGVGR